MKAAIPNVRPKLDRTRVPVPGEPGTLALPEFRRFTLSCGMPVVLVERHDLPLVAMELLIPGGASAVPGTRAGLASLTADLLDEGAGERSALDLSLALEELGIALDSSAGYDDAHVTLLALRDRLPDGLRLLADVARRPRFESEELERVREERIDLSLQLSDEPRSVANDVLGETLYGEAHPWGPPLLGTRATLESFTRDEVTAHHARHYHAGNATLLVAGDVSADLLGELLEARFAGWRCGDPVRCVLPDAPDPGSPSVRLVDRPGAAQSEIRVGCVAAARSAPDYFAVLVLNTVLGGAFTSRLNARLREEKGFTYGARSGFHTRCAPGPFVARAAVHTPATAESVSIVLEEIAGLVAHPVPEEELERAKRYAALRLPQRFETVGDLVSRVAELSLHGLPDDYWEGYVPRLMQVDAEEVRAAARRYLDPARMVSVVVGDRAAVEPGLRDLGLPIQPVEPGS